MAHARTRIKICGIRDHEAAAAAVDAGADSIGFVFVKDSPRWIEPADAARLMFALPPFITTVSLFKNSPVDLFCDIEEQCPTTTSQLHGSEDPATLEQCGPAIKAIRFDAESIDADLKKWDEVDACEAILVDGGAGGEGTTFPWQELADAASKITTPIIVAGGLTADNVADAIRIVRPFAVDVSSGVERARGEKDPALIAEFCQSVREADASA